MERRGEKTENVNISWICERTSRQYNEECGGRTLKVRTGGFIFIKEKKNRN